MNHLTTTEFKEQIFDYETNKEDFVFKGKNITIIDFYADWCQPCKMLTPILEELDAEIDDVDIFSVDTEAETELSQVFGIRSIPSILFIPIEGKPVMSMGVLPKEKILEIIEDLKTGKDFAEEDEK